MHVTDRTPATMRRSVLLVFLAIAGGAHAEWLAIGRNETVRAYLDQSSLRKNGDYVQALQLTDFVTAQWVDATTVIGSIKATIEYDCSQPRFRTLALDAYSEQMGDGKLVAAERVPEPVWETIQAGSTNEKIRQLTCKK